MTIVCKDKRNQPDPNTALCVFLSVYKDFSFNMDKDGCGSTDEPVSALSMYIDFNFAKRFTLRLNGKSKA
jgi:hypothetical protein